MVRIQIPMFSTDSTELPFFVQANSLLWKEGRRNGRKEGREQRKELRFFWVPIIQTWPYTEWVRNACLDVCLFHVLQNKNKQNISQPLSLIVSKVTWTFPFKPCPLSHIFMLHSERIWCTAHLFIAQTIQLQGRWFHWKINKLLTKPYWFVNDQLCWHCRLQGT